VFERDPEFAVSESAAVRPNADGAGGRSVHPIRTCRRPHCEHLAADDKRSSGAL
jgi:hypothetical protein